MSDDDYDWTKDAARSYDLAIAECRARALRGEPVTIGGKPVVLEPEPDRSRTGAEMGRGG